MSHHTLFNIPSSQYVNEQTFRILTDSSENPMYKVAKAMQVTPEVTIGAVHTAQSSVFVVPECWWKPVERPRRSSLKRVHTITKRAGMAIKERRREEQEYRSVAAYYANAFYQ